MIAKALSIAGSDPSGGAGIQADLKTFSALGVYGMSAVTALTAQNTQGVQAVHLSPADFVAAQITSVLSDVETHAIKIGMIATAGIASAVADALGAFDTGPVVLDPVMIAKGGASLLDPDAVGALRDALLPKAALVTPNLPEAAALLSMPVATTRADMEAQAARLLQLGPEWVLLKGGHLEGPDSPDLLTNGQAQFWLESPRVETRNTHGTGCTLSAACAAELAKGADMSDAVRAAKAYVTGAIAGADQLDVGSGHGPTHHFHALW